MAKKILLAVLGVVAASMVVVSLQPSKFTVERSATINAPPALVFGLIDTPSNRPSWYPWTKLDPNQKNTFSDTKSGVGASFSWVGNDKVGEGRQTIVASTLNGKVVDRLDFEKPMKMTNTSTFTLVPTGNDTQLTWAMSGDNNFMGKAFSLFVDMDKMLGKDFEEGLANLNTIASTQARAAAAAASAASAVPPPPATPPAVPNNGASLQVY